MPIKRYYKPNGPPALRQLSGLRVGASRYTYGPDWFKTSKDIQTRDGNRCLDCGGTEHLHTHHIRRLGESGTGSKANLMTLCHTCYSARHHGKDVQVPSGSGNRRSK